MIRLQSSIAMVLLAASATSLAAQAPATPPTATPTATPTPAPPQYPLHRIYREGETLAYQMKGQNEAWHYTVRADGIVTKSGASGAQGSASGPFLEEYRWSGMESDGKPVTLSAEMQAYRQKVSLDPSYMPGMPDLSKVDRALVGPITDFMTFYSDEWLANRMGVLKKPGGHFYFAVPFNPSWADGTRVILGEDSIAFDMTWKSTNEADHTALILIRHVSPAQPTIHLTADWMKKPVADAPNNWVEVEKTPDGKFEAGVGNETFDVELTVDLSDGKILSGTMDNTVKTVHCTCEDQALTKCNTLAPHEINRKIEIALVKQPETVPEPSKRQLSTRQQGLLRAFSIQILTFRDRRRWHFLEENATLRLGFCIHLDRKTL